jgi:hypothetical protein
LVFCTVSSCVSPPQDLVTLRAIVLTNLPPVTIYCACGLHDCTTVETRLLLLSPQHRAGKCVSLWHDAGISWRSPWREIGAVYDFSVSQKTLDNIPPFATNRWRYDLTPNSIFGKVTRVRSQQQEMSNHPTGGDVH